MGPVTWICPAAKWNDRSIVFRIISTLTRVQYVYDGLFANLAMKRKLIHIISLLKIL